jgi:hypothetical protein
VGDGQVEGVGLVVCDQLVPHCSLKGSSLFFLDPFLEIAYQRVELVVCQNCLAVP